MKLIFGLFIFVIIFSAINSQNIVQSPFTYFEINNGFCGNVVTYYTINTTNNGCIRSCDDTNVSANFVKIVQSTTTNDTFTATEYTDSTCTNLPATNGQQFTFTCQNDNNQFTLQSGQRIRCYNLNTQAPIPKNVDDSSSSDRLIISCSILFLGFIIALLL
ncbi:hypothetical protein RB653_000256 [Dictyostelium firmibasis]|uniref:Transmembrane protein n=1 Tax=Dictyostelium firmibasis TaxID=79012 RepID=A0AAN7U2Y8_9MYCE